MVFHKRLSVLQYQTDKTHQQMVILYNNTDVLPAERYPFAYGIRIPLLGRYFVGGFLVINFIDYVTDFKPMVRPNIDGLVIIIGAIILIMITAISRESNISRKGGGDSRVRILMMSIATQMPRSC